MTMLHCCHTSRSLRSVMLTARSSYLTSSPLISSQLQRWFHSSLHRFAPIPAASARTHKPRASPAPSSSSSSSSPSPPHRHHALLSDELQHILHRHSTSKLKHVRSKPDTPTKSNSPKPSTPSSAQARHKAMPPTQPASVHFPPPPLPLSSSPPIQLVDVHRTASPPLLASALRSVVTARGPIRLSTLTTSEHYATIPPSSNLRLSHLPPFLTSSRDPLLLSIAASHSALVACSSSSTTPLLSRFYMAQVGESTIDLSSLSPAFQNEPDTMTRRTRAPVAVTLRKRRVKDGEIQEQLTTIEQLEKGERGSEGGVVVWGMDRGYEYEAGTKEDILLRLGHSLEHMFTMEPSDFNSFFLTTSPSPPPFTSTNAYLFSLANRLLMRSQLDCQDPRLPLPIFDIKTRAVWPIRYDLPNWRDNVRYQIEEDKGLRRSFEKEWYDMARSAFLKYALQCRMGRMEGVMVAYHNTETVFGLEMIGVKEMERVMLGEHAEVMGERVYEMSVRMLDEVGRRVVETVEEMHDGREECIKLVVAQQRDESRLSIFAELIPPPTEDFDRHLPFTHRHATLYRLDRLSLPSLLTIADAHHVQHHTDEDRRRLLERLEAKLSSTTTRYLPPVAHVVGLLKRGRLLKFEVDVQHFDEEGMRVKGWRGMERGRVEGLTSGYGVARVDVVGRGEEGVTKVAWEYIRLLREGYFLEKEEDEDEDGVREKKGKARRRSSGVMTFSGVTDGGSVDVKEVDVNEKFAKAQIKG